MKKAKTQHESIQGETRTQNLSVITREESVVEDISRHQLQSHNQAYLVASFCSNVHVVTGHLATKQTRHQQTRHQGTISPPTFSPPTFIKFEYRQANKLIGFERALATNLYKV